MRPSSGAHEAGDHVERQRLARSARPEQDRDARRGAEFEIEREGSRVRPRRETLSNLELEHQAACLAAASRLAERQNHHRHHRDDQDQRSRQRSVARFHGIVNRHRQRLRPARNIARDHDA